MRPVTIEFNQGESWIAEADVPALEALAALVVEREIASPAESFEVSVSLVTDSVMRALHWQYFNDDSETDIITFPGDAPGELGSYLGDLVICGEIAQAQAHEAQHSILREVAFLIVHGLLHIAGWDDTDPDQRTAMLQRQEALVQEYEALCGVAL